MLTSSEEYLNPVMSPVNIYHFTSSLLPSSAQTILPCPSLALKAFMRILGLSVPQSLLFAKTDVFPWQVSSFQEFFIGPVESYLLSAKDLLIYQLSTPIPESLSYT